MKTKVAMGVLLGLSLLSCSDPAGPGAQSVTRTLGSLTGISGAPGKSLFLAKVDLGSPSTKALRARQAADPDVLPSIAYVSGDGTVLPLVFKDSQGHQLVLNTELVRQLGPTAIGVRYSGVTEVTVTPSGVSKEETFTKAGSCLIDFSLNKAYSLDGYNIADSTFWNGKIYIVKDQNTVYEIDPSVPGVATPMNNPVFNPLNGIQFVVGSKLVVGSTSLDLNRNFPPKAIRGSSLDIYPSGGQVMVNTFNSAVLFDGLGQLWGLSIGKTSIVYYRMTLDDDGFTVVPRVNGVQDVHEYVFTGTLAFTNIGNSLIGFTTNQGANVTSSSPLLIFGSDAYGHGGYVKVSGNPGGGLDFTSAANEYTLSDAPIAWGLDKVVLGDSLYWISPATTTLYRMNLTTGVQSEEYKSPSLINVKAGTVPLLVATGDLLMFYAYEGPLQISSYTLKPQSGTPVKVASFQMDVDRLMELVF